MIAITGRQDLTEDEEVSVTQDEDSDEEEITKNKTMNNELRNNNKTIINEEIHNNTKTIIPHTSPPPPMQSTKLPGLVPVSTPQHLNHALHAKVSAAISNVDTLHTTKSIIDSLHSVNNKSITEDIHNKIMNDGIFNNNKKVNDVLNSPAIPFNNAIHEKSVPLPSPIVEAHRQDEPPKIISTNSLTNGNTPVLPEAHHQPTPSALIPDPNNQAPPPSSLLHQQTDPQTAPADLSMNKSSI